MRKEIVIAIIIGLGFGLFVSFGVYRARKSLDDSSTIADTSTATTPNPTASPLSALVLISPDDESIQNTATTKITGTTTVNATVIVFVNDTPHITTADQSGNFSIEATLDSGSNIIVVRSIDEDGKVAEEQRTVIFDTTSLETKTASGSASPAPSPTATTNL